MASFTQETASIVSSILAEIASIYSMVKLTTCSCCIAGTSVFHLNTPVFCFPICLGFFLMTSVLTALVLAVLDSPPMQTYDPVTFSFLSL